jgi:hypothetical protein
MAASPPARGSASSSEAALPSQGRNLRRPLIVLAAAIVGGAAGYLLALQGVLSYYGSDPRIPAPHVVPKIAGGTALSLAMVDDVLCERFIRHSDAWYEARNEARRRSLEAARRGREDEPLSFAELEDMDDLAVGLDMIGQSEEAIVVGREKHEYVRPYEEAWKTRRLELMADGTLATRTPEDLTAEELALYRTYANLGTHLIHASFKKFFSGDEEARQRVEEGLDFIRRAVEINPEAHFGRELWQIVACEYILAARRHPELWTRHDLVGNAWLEGPLREASVAQPGWPARYAALEDGPAVIARLRSAASRGDAEAEKLRHDLRTGGITRVGSEGDYVNLVQSSQPAGVPFDEPALGVMGMWMLGGGANPHFALVLGGIMERVGEHRLAWRGYERAHQLSDRYSHDEALRQKLRNHCRVRQALLAARLAEPGEEEKAAGERLRREFDADLKRGLDYRAALHDYTRQQLEEGRDIDDELFFEGFARGRGTIHTPVARLDSVPISLTPAQRTLDGLPAAALFAGVGGILGLFLSGRIKPRDA